MTGYGLDSTEMVSVADKVDSIQTTVTDDASDVGKTTIEAKDFGRAHTQAGTPFTALVTALGKLVSAQAIAMKGYSSLLRDTNSGYDANEWTNSDIFTNTSGV